MIFNSTMDSSTGYFMTNENNVLGFRTLALQTGQQVNPWNMNTSLEFNGSEITLSKKLIQIPLSEYKKWKHKYIFDALRGARFGQSFCMAFDLQDMILWYEQDPHWCEGYIQREYVQ